jgi:predicted component of type VI protein secretion system
MFSINGKLRILAAAFTAAALAGCGGNNETTVPVTTPPPTSIQFSVFANQAFSNSANSSPVAVDYTFNFDVNDDPTAFDGAIASGTY